MEKTIKRNDLIDNAKAIGIIAIMIGHSCATLPITKFPAGLFVYTFHLMIFFFTTGFCYNQEKYAEKPHEFIGKRVYSSVCLFLVYQFAFVILHNLLCSLSLISADKYTVYDICSQAFIGIVATTNESMLGAFWFIGIFLVASFAFGLIFSTTHSISKLFKNSATAKKIKYLLDITAFSLSGAFGIIINLKNMKMPYHIQTVFLALPVMYLGWIAKKNYTKIERFLCLPGCIISAVILWLAVWKGNFQVELSVNLVAGGWAFYPITLVGIYFCMSLGRFITKFKRISSVVAFIGKNSFHYMALHFSAFKLLDLIVSLIKGDSMEIRAEFPHSYDLGLLYTLFALVIIGILLFAAEKIKDKINKKTSE